MNKVKTLERRIEKFEPPPVREEDRALMQEAESDWILTHLSTAEMREIQAEKSTTRFHMLWALAEARAAKEHPYHAHEYKQRVMEVQRLRSKSELSWEEKRRLWWYSTWLNIQRTHLQETLNQQERLKTTESYTDERGGE